jgi:hypothetical protein
MNEILQDSSPEATLFEPDREEVTDDHELAEVASTIKNLDPTGERWSKVIRHTYDMLYNGQETGRYKWDQLMKTEKTHFGTLFEINAQREFEFAGGKETDYRIAGHQVDAKWSQSEGGWMLPPEVFDRLALVGTGDDANAEWSLGLIRVTEDVRREGGNRDRKSQLTAEGRKAITWLWRNADLPPNILLQLDEESVAEIFKLRSGSQRTNALFRAAEGKLVHRNAVATVSRQLDHQKRVRYNGGARSALQPEGIIILSGVWERQKVIANELEVDVPGRDQYVSVRVVPAEIGEKGSYISGSRWRRANPDEPSTVAAPRIDDGGPKQTAES